MIIQCGACGYLRDISHRGKPEEVERQMYETIKDGWRYVKSYDGYICPTCIKDNPDKLYETYVGKIKPASRAESYKAILNSMKDFLRELWSLN